MSILDSCVILSLHCSEYGTQRPVPKNLVTYGNGKDEGKDEATLKADQDRAKRLLKTGKTILADKRIDAIGTHEGKLRRAVVELYTVPVKKDSFLRAGYYPLPIPLIKEANARLEEGRAIREALIEEAALALPEMIANDKLIFEPVGLFNPLDYPTVNQFRAAHRMRVEYLKFSVPGETLEEIDPALRAKVEQDFLDNVDKAQQQAVGIMQAMFTVLITRMKEALEPGENGAKKKFHASAVDNILEYVQTFKQRWAAAAGSSDDTLVKLVSEASALLEGTDVQQFRLVDSFRVQMREKFTSIADQLATLTETQGRAYSFDEEEVAA